MVLLAARTLPLSHDKATQSQEEKDNDKESRIISLASPHMIRGSSYASMQYSDEATERKKKFRDCMKAGRKTVRDDIASVVDPDLLGPSRSVRNILENLLHQKANSGNLTAALCQVEAAEALYVYRLRGIVRHEIKLGRNRVVGG
jgi:hypothetical protein